MFHIEFYPNWIENIDIMVIISFTAIVKYGFTIRILTKLTVSQLHCTEFHTYWPRNTGSIGQKFIYTLKYVEKNKSSENFKTTIPSKNYGRPKTTRECGIF